MRNTPRRGSPHRWPLTISGAVDRLLDEISVETMAQIVALPEDGLISLRFGLGQHIRNAFGLWEGNDTLLRACGTIEPDDASMVILEALWERLQQAYEE